MKPQHVLSKEGSEPFSLQGQIFKATWSVGKCTKAEWKNFVCSEEKEAKFQPIIEN